MMMHLGSAPVPGILDPPGTPGGDQKRNEFIAAVLAICGDVRAFWLPLITDTTATTGVSREARAFTYDADIASRITRLGSGMQVDFDGTDDEADSVDELNLSFGDGAVDQPFSVLWVGNPDSDASVQTLVSKMNSATVDEWELFIEVTTGHVAFDLVDANVSAFIGRQDETAIGTSDTFIAATYDGSGTVSGINLYKDAVLVDDEDSAATTGTYVAMENTASLLRLGNRFTTPEQFYNGRMAMAVVTAKELVIAEIWALKEAINGFLDLSL